jgi:stage II sporulation protein AA (anti-sigma F factor antagonist)
VDLLTATVTARESAGAPHTVLAVSGQIDVTNSDQLRDLLDSEVAQLPRHFIIDLSGLRFMDSSGLHAILRANRALGRHGGILSLLAPQEAVARMLCLTAADRLIPVYTSLEDVPDERPLPSRYIELLLYVAVPTTQVPSASTVRWVGVRRKGHRFLILTPAAPQPAIW